jgi:two-component sensor histidine kinase
MIQASANHANSFFGKNGLRQNARDGASMDRSPWPVLEQTLNCLGIEEEGGEPETLSDEIKKRDRQILYQRLLLEEVIHRTNTTLRRAISAVDAQIAVVNDVWKARDLRALRGQLRRLSGTHHQLFGPGDCLGSSLKARLTGISSSLFESFGRSSALVALSLKVADIELRQDQEICVCLMAQELVTNALKHGFPFDRSGLVSVELSVDLSSVCHLTVADNGVGRRAVRHGTGLALVRGFASLLEGDLELHLNEGTTAKVSFPVEP